MADPCTCGHLPGEDCREDICPFGDSYPVPERRGLLARLRDWRRRREPDDGT